MTNFEKVVLDVAKIIVSDENRDLARVICSDLDIDCKLCPIRFRCNDKTLDGWLRAEVEDEDN